MEKDLTIIIVTYNSKNIITDCLNGIIDSSFRIILVDNASSDETVKVVLSNFPSVEIIKSDKNLGYGKAANLAFRQTKTRYCLLMNPDVITTSETIKYLFEKSINFGNAGIFAPRLRKDNYDKSKEYEFKDWVSGAMMLIDMEKLNQVGFFDENIFLFFEETDLCKRFLLKGYKIIMFNDIYVRHLTGKSSSINEKILYMKYWHFAWSRFYFNKKYKSSVGFTRSSISYLSKFLLKFLFYSLSDNFEKKIKYKASISASISFLLGTKAFNKTGCPKFS